MRGDVSTIFIFLTNPYIVFNDAERNYGHIVFLRSSSSSFSLGKSSAYSYTCHTFLWGHHQVLLVYSALTTEWIHIIVYIWSNSFDACEQDEVYKNTEWYKKIYLIEVMLGFHRRHSNYVTYDDSTICDMTVHRPPFLYITRMSDIFFLLTFWLILVCMRLLSHIWHMSICRQNTIYVTTIWQQVFLLVVAYVAAYRIGMYYVCHHICPLKYDASGNTVPLWRPGGMWYEDNRHISYSACGNLALCAEIILILVYVVNA